MFEELRDLFWKGGTEKQKEEASVVTVNVFSGTAETGGVVHGSINLLLYNSIGNQNSQNSEMLSED